MRTRAIEVLFWGSVVVATGLVLGVWQWLLQHGFTALVVAAALIVVVGTPLLMFGGAVEIARRVWQRRIQQ